VILLAGPELLLTDQVQGKFGRDEIPPKTHSVSGLKHIFFLQFLAIFPDASSSNNMRAEPRMRGSELSDISIKWRGFQRNLTGGYKKVFRYARI
jgi:hypothetical protein